MDRGFASMARGLYLSAQRFPDKPALIEIDRITLTYVQLLDGCERLAHHLAARGVQKGDHVAILSENSIEHIVALYAVAILGAVSIALDPKWTPYETQRAINLFDCRILIIDKALEAKGAPLVPGTPPLGVVTYEKHPHSLPLIEDLARDVRISPLADVKDHDICTIILTSGTTGVPKGVMRSHRNVEIGCMNGVMGKGQTETSRELAVVPIFYGSGRGSVIGQIFLGATVYIMPSFDVERCADIIHREAITAIALAPTICRRLLQLPGLERFDFSSIRSLRKAGSPFPAGMAQEVMSRITPNIYQGYASTETGSVTLLRPHEQLTKHGSSGILEWGVEAEIVDSEGHPVPAGGEGEICVRGPNVCEGYYRNPDEEARAFRGGWFRTGDLGRFDGDGHLYIIGRIKDTIKTGSINVSPREIETQILCMPQIEDVAVVGVPDPEWGEAVKAFIVLREGQSCGEADVLAHCRSHLAGYKIPKSVAFVEEIERNGLGKVTAEFKMRARG